MATGPLPNLPSLLKAIGQAQTKAQRSLAFDDLVAVLQATDNAVPFVKKMIATGRHGRRIAFEILVRLPLPIPFELVGHAIPYLGKRLPSSLRKRAAKQLLESLSLEHELVPRLLDSFIRKLNPDAAVHRLQSLQEICSRPEIQTRIAKLKQFNEKSCPRCRIRLSPEELVQHLWLEHRLLYDGEKVREPWEVITSWVTLSLRMNDSSYLEKATYLAKTIDPETGPHRLNRILLALDQNDLQSQAHLREQAIRTQGSLCPTCFALVPVSHALPRRPYVFAAGGTIEWEDYRIEVKEEGLLTHLKIQGKDLPRYHRPEPQIPLTRRGVVWLCCFPLLCLAVFATLIADRRMAHPLLISSTLIMLAIVAYYWVRHRWDSLALPTDRAVDYAWEFLEDHETSSSFVTGLLCVSLKRGTPEIRERLLEKMLANLRKANTSVLELQLLIELQSRDAIQSGQDPLLPLARLAGDCFEGLVPLSVLETTLFELRDENKSESRSRLRVLLIAQAFRAGLTPLDLRDLGRACPNLGETLASEDIKGISRLYVLHEMRNTRPWMRMGSAATVFDLARYPALGGDFLAEHPNLLLVQFGTDLRKEEGESSTLLICEDGIIFNQQTIGRDTVFRVRQRSVLRGGGYDFYIDEQIYRFKNSPLRLKERLEFWRDFLFGKLRPASRHVERHSGKRDVLLNPHLVTCPECRTTFLGIIGEIGLKNFQEEDDL
ncbi:MAG: hypothetical protein N2112_06960 [Gemmataceae bacterium]|jgi:hypothetical protein|nr:hypothetical protein [Gemmataceae bacterium]